MAPYFMVIEHKLTYKKDVPHSPKTGEAKETSPSLPLFYLQLTRHNTLLFTC